MRLEGNEGKGGQTLSSCLPYCRMSAEVRRAAHPQGRRKAGGPRSRNRLPAQVPCDLRYMVSLGRSRPSNRPAVAWPQRHGINAAVSQAIAQRGHAREGKRDLRLAHRVRYCLAIQSETVFGQNRTQVPMRKDGIFPAFACL